METKEWDIREYLAWNGKCPFRDWLRSLKDVKARARIRVRINRIRLGNFGDCKAVGSGVSEIRIDYGPGYRVYPTLAFTLVVSVKNWYYCYVKAPKKVKKKTLNSQRNIGMIIKGEKMSKTSISYRKGLLKDLRDNVEAAAYLNAALEDGSQEVFMLALRDVADAKGISDLAKKSGLNRENMYRILSEKGNPQLGSLSVLLESMGLKLAVEVKESKAA